MRGAAGILNPSGPSESDSIREADYLIRDVVEPAGDMLIYQMLSADVEPLASLSQKYSDENKCAKQLEGVMPLDGDGCQAPNRL